MFGRVIEGPVHAFFEENNRTGLPKPHHQRRALRLSFRMLCQAGIVSSDNGTFMAGLMPNGENLAQSCCRDHFYASKSLCYLEDTFRMCRDPSTIPVGALSA